jgi:hypothetical protein
MLFKNPVRTSKRTPHFTITAINWLTPFKEIIAVYSGNNTMNIAGKDVEGIGRGLMLFTIPALDWRRRRDIMRTCQDGQSVGRETFCSNRPIINVFAFEQLRLLLPGGIIQNVSCTAAILLCTVHRHLSSHHY